MHCKGLMVFVCCVAILLVPKSNISGEPNLDLNWKNADFVIFQDSISRAISDNDAEVSPEDRSGMQAWYLALRKAATLLPAGFVKEIATDFGDSDCWGWETRPGCVRTWIRFGFFIDSASWATAYPDSINLRSSVAELPYWLTWEPFPKDGYTEEERIWVALHEFAHRYQFSSNGELLNAEDFGTEPPTTLYGCISGIENFPDTFALYVMFPKQLERFPLSYNGIKDILGREYEAKFQMPNSVASKLTDPTNGCKQYDQELARIMNEQFLAMNTK